MRVVVLLTQPWRPRPWHSGARDLDSGGAGRDASLTRSTFEEQTTFVAMERTSADRIPIT